METKNPLSSDSRVHHGHNLRNFREKQNMEIAELSKKVKISQEEIQKLEEMQRIDDDTLKKMSDALGVSVDTIKLLKEEKTPEIVQTNNNTFTQNQTNENNPDSTINQGNDDMGSNIRDKAYNQEGLSSIEYITKSYNTMLKIERERNDKLQEIIEKLIGQREDKDNPSPEK